MAEKEYIERGAVISCILEVNHNLAGVIQHINEHVPAADVEEMVRCIKCIYRDKKGVCEKFRQRYPFFPEDDFYCGFGEKKEQK